MTILHLSNADYHDHAAIGSTGLKLILRSPAHFRYQEPVDHDTRAKQIGTAFHCAILEPDRFAKDYIVAKCDDRRKSEYKGLASDVGVEIFRQEKKYKAPEFHTAEFKKSSEYKDLLYVLGSRLVLTRDEHRRVMNGQASAYRNNKVRELLEYPGRYELSVTAKCPETGVLVKCRFDKKLDDFRAFDLKKTQDARPHAFGRSIDAYQYYLSVAFYMDVWYWAFGERIQAMPLIAIEEKAPHGCMVHNLPDDWIQQGRYEYQQALRIYADCVEKDEWPSYEDEECEAEMPSWRIRELEDEVEIGGLGDE